MSNKYIGQINNDNFVFPNNKLAEYDVDIIHDINNNSVSGTTSGFSILYNSGTGNLQCSFTYWWYKNNAEVLIDNEGKLQILSLHLMGPDKKFFKPWTCVGFIDDVNTSITTKADTQNFIITPAMMGVTSFVGGTYYAEIRFIGHRAIFPISASSFVSIVTPTPTPITGCTQSNVCMKLVVTGVTSIEGPFAQFEYNNCDGEFVGEFFTSNGTYYRCVQYFDGIPQIVSYTLMETPIINSGNCNVYPCGESPTPTPTPTPGGPTPTPTPTPTLASYYVYNIGADQASRTNACTNFNIDPLSEVYAATNNPRTVSRFFVDTSLTTPFIGSGDWYAWRLGASGPADSGGQVSAGGFVTNIASC